ncbi:MAG: hypothetical protein IPI23_00770 [Bacteroidetes bacterium]|nr:hypothetical protein [Bacteroidota bacterium]
MKEIICDTNIYYYIGDSKISVQVFPDSILNSTILNILELATSRNLIDKFDFTRKAIQAAIKTGPMNPDSPFVHLAKLKDPVFI